MNLVLLERHEVDDTGAVRLSGPRAEHLVRVLKVASGHEVRMGLVDGPLGVGTVQSVEEGSVTVRCAFGGSAPPRPRVDLLLALPRPKVMRRLWAQIAALGVGRVLVTNAERVERNYFDAHVLEPATYRALLIEGLQQARDTRVPVVSIHRQFKILVEDELDGLFDGGLRLVADPGATRVASTVAREAGVGRVLLAGGPEGGWNRFELDLLGRHGFEQIGMGARTLRTDTACVALLALVHDALAVRGH